MDETLRRDNPNPFLSANPISKIFFSWLNPLFKKGCKGWLEETDMYNTCPSDQSKILGDKIESSWKKELMCKDLGGKPSLLRALVRTFWLEYVLWGLILLVEGGIEVSQPILLAQLLDYFTPDPSTTRTEAWIYATAIVFSSMVLAISHHPYSFSAARMGMRVRIGCCSLMFKKSLRLSNRSLNESSVGQIVNLMSNDVARFDQALMFFHFLAVGPIQALAALGILWHEVGPSVLAGLAVLVLLMPTQIIMGKIFSKLRRKTAIHTDKRVKVMNEIISGMRIIKMYCWEKPFRHLVEKLRSDEVRHLRRTRRIQACVLGPYFATSQLSIFLLFLVFTLTGHEDKMRPSTIFLIMGVIQCVRLTCGLLLPIASQQLAETLAVVKRIEEFLLREELVRISNTHSRNDILRNEESKNADKRHDIGVEMDNVTAKWEGRTSETNTLEDITLKVMPGELLAVIGPVGAGKTSMLMSILGELPLQSGTVKAQGKIAYVSQHPWVFSGSVRQNIVFGAPFDKTRYDKIIKICALSR
ncbi:cystic fibrosis transmembrane conductance regulator [Plakobranchus ocellatus]|uniref:Cystic fibrosis transmembrane conductance regulator n=1 Tax=Plakobranchus ocellatus TaxID=259542 RepID=A0AAV3YHF1_9GAST|nr:cystic fibrosis transmembrane conductance regulator [Plakobranchus ocellatus]